MTNLYSYLAGVFDGEGTVQINTRTQKNRTTPSLEMRLSLANTDFRIPILFHKTFGGSYIELPPKGTRRSSLDWRVNGKVAIEAANRLIEFSVTKKDQLLLFLYIGETVVKIGGRTGDEVNAERSRISLMSKQLIHADWSGETDFAKQLLDERLKELGWSLLR